MSDLSNWGQHGKLRDDVEYGVHIQLYCVNHPDLRWSTKNIAPIGARNIFFQGSASAPDTFPRECDCPCSALRVLT
jgi:hypothetical protein